MRNTVNTDADRIDKIENQLSELKDLICTRFQSDNKHVEKYNSVISEKSVYKPTETFQYTHYSSCHPPGVKKGFIKGEAIRGVCVGLSMTFSITLTVTTKTFTSLDAR